MNHSSNIPDDDYPSARDDLDDPRSRTRHFAGTVAVPSLPGAMEHLSRRQSAPNPGDSPLQPSFPSPTHQYGPRIGQVAAQPHLHGYVDSQTRSHSYHSSNSQWTSTGGGQPNQASLPQPPYTTSDAHTSTMPYPSHSHLHDYASDVSNQRSSHFYEPSHPNTRVDIPPYHYQSPTSGVMSHDHLGMRPSSFAYSGPVGVRSSQACVACRKRKVRCTVIQSDMTQSSGSGQGSIEKLCVRCSRLGIDCIWKDERKAKTKSRSQPNDAPEQHVLTVDTASTSQAGPNTTSPSLSGSSTGSGALQRQQALSVRTPSSPAFSSFPPGSATSDPSYPHHNAYDPTSFATHGHDPDQQGQQHSRISSNYVGGMNSSNATPTRYSAPDPSIYTAHDLASIRRTSMGNLSRASPVLATPVRETPLPQVAHSPVFYPYSVYSEQQQQRPLYEDNTLSSGSGIGTGGNVPIRSDESQNTTTLHHYAPQSRTYTPQSPLQHQHVQHLPYPPRQQGYQYHSEQQLQQPPPPPR